MSGANTGLCEAHLSGKAGLALTHWEQQATLLRGLPPPPSALPLQGQQHFREGGGCWAGACRAFLYLPRGSESSDPIPGAQAAASRACGVGPCVGSGFGPWPRYLLPSGSVLAAVTGTTGATNTFLFVTQHCYQRLTFKLST